MHAGKAELLGQKPQGRRSWLFRWAGRWAWDMSSSGHLHITMVRDLAFCPLAWFVFEADVSDSRHTGLSHVRRDFPVSVERW